MAEDAAVTIALKFLDEATAPMKNALEQVNSMLSFTSQAVKTFLGAFALKDFLQLGDNYEKAIIKMRYTWTENTDQMIAQAKKISEQTGKYYTFSDIAQAMVRTKDLATQMGLTQTEYLSGISRAMQIAAGKSMDLEQAMRLLERAAAGNKKAMIEVGVWVTDDYMRYTALGGKLSELWPRFDEGTKFLYRWTEALRQSDKPFDAVAASAGTLEGSFKILWNTLKSAMSPEIANTTRELAKNVQGMVPVVKDLGSAVAGVVSIFNGLPEWAKGPAGLGIVGAILFGPEVGGIIAAIDLLIPKIKELFGTWAAQQPQFKLPATEYTDQNILDYVINKVIDILTMEGKGKPVTERTGTLPQRPPSIPDLGGSFYSVPSSTTMGSTGVSTAVTEAAKSVYGKEWEAAIKNLTSVTSDLIKKYAEQYWVSPEFAKSILGAESAFRQYDKSGNVLTSPKGAMGIGQLMPGTAEKWGVDPTQLEDNIKGSFQELDHLFKVFGDDLTKVAAAYNAGERAVKKYGGTPPYNETQNYVKRVLGYQSLQGGSSPDPLEDRQNFIPGLDVTKELQKLQDKFSEVAKLAKDQMEDYAAADAKLWGDNMGVQIAQINKATIDFEAKIWKVVEGAQTAYVELEKKLAGEGETPSAEQKALLDAAWEWRRGALETRSKTVEALTGTAIVADSAQLAQLKVSYAELTTTMEQQLQAKMNLIDAQAREKGIYDLLVPQINATTEQYRKLFVEQKRVAEVWKSGSFTDGMSEAIRQMRNALPTAAQQGADIMRTTYTGLARDIGSGFGTFVSDVFTGKITSMKEAWSELCTFMQRVFGNAISNIVSKYLENQIMGLLKGSSSPLVSSLVGGGGATTAMGEAAAWATPEIAALGVSAAQAAAALSMIGGSSALSAMESLPLGSLAGFGFYAAGGRPPTNQPSIVGEQGPELFWPDTAGTVVPNSALSARQNVNLQVNLENKSGTEMRVEQGAISINESGNLSASFTLHRLSRDSDFRSQFKAVLGR